jgi:hypothetical protein
MFLTFSFKKKVWFAYPSQICFWWPQIQLFPFKKPKCHIQTLFSRPFLLSPFFLCFLFPLGSHKPMLKSWLFYIYIIYHIFIFSFLFKFSLSKKNGKIKVENNHIIGFIQMKSNIVIFIFIFKSLNMDSTKSDTFCTQNYCLSPFSPSFFFIRESNRLRTIT